MPPNTSSSDTATATATSTPTTKSPSSASTKPISFTEFCHPRPFSPGILTYVEQNAFTHLTPVQAATIPHFLSYKDVAVQAVTGSGKTLAFVIPLVELLLVQQQQQRSRTQLGGLILAPTRELAAQTYRVTTGVCAAVGLPPPVLWTGGGGGGSSTSSTARPVSADLAAWAAEGSDIVVGTPGRVQDVLSRYGSVDCSALECLVLDEADRLLESNSGFAATLAEIVRLLPKQRRTALFSATQSTAATRSQVKEWMHRMGMRNPMWIDVTVTAKRTAENGTGTHDATLQQKQVTPASLTNYYVVCPLEEKLSRLVAFLREHRSEKKIVFFLTCASVDFFGNALQHILQDGDDTIALLHGKMVQKRRDKTLERFRDTTTNGTNTLCCTDVASRGLDVPNVELVVQWDAPQHPSVFIHRAGRAGRAGQAGKSLVFLTPTEEPYVDLLASRSVPLAPLPKTEQCVGRDMYDDDDEQREEEKRQAKPGALWNAAGQELEDVLPKVRALVCKDRDILEKGTKAYTSYIRAYKEHHCSFIFRFKALDLGRLATLFCLLRLPKMPELREALQKHKKNGGGLPHFVSAGPEINIFAIPYLDKTREAARQKRLAQELAAGGKTAKHIQAEKKKADRERKSKLQQKKRNSSRSTHVADEWDDLAKEERLFKKLRRGKITQKEYDERLLDDGGL